MKIKGIALAFGFAFLASSVHGTIHIDSINANLQRQLMMFPQEKFHIMTDQSQYMGGDTLWLRGFVVDAATNRPAAASKYLYVEIRNPFDSIEQRIKIAEQNGIYAGHMPIDANIAEGEYTLTAYTRYAESQSPDFFFKKKINIRSPFSTVREIKPEFHTDGDKLAISINYTDRATGQPQEYNSMTYRTSTGKVREFSASKNTRNLKLSANDRKKGTLFVRYNSYAKYITIPTDDDPFSITFHPEGGHAVTGVPNRIAFKAIDTTGRGTSIKGKIIDAAGETVTEIQDTHLGMGSFVIIPQSGEKYTAIVTDGTTEVSCSLPEATDSIPTLRVDNSRATIVCIATAGPVPPGTIIAGTQHGQLLFAAPATGKALNIDKKEFSNGIVQILLIDPNGNTLSERLTFIRHDGPKAGLASHLSAYLTRTNAKMTLNIDGYHAPTGNFAVSVTDDMLANTDSSVTIASQLLLQGDLKGHVEDAGYYFRNPSRRTDAALDALMMTQGWRRYDVPAVINGTFATPQTAIEYGQEITGKVTTLWRNKPMKDAVISVVAPKFGFADAVTTGDDGKFIIDRLNFPNGTKFLVQALNQKGKGDVNFSIDSHSIPAVASLPPKPVSSSDTTGVVNNENHAKWKMMRNNGLMEILLDEISVTHRKTGNSDDGEYGALASKSIDRDQIEKERIMNYEAIISKIGGLTNSGGVLTYHGKPVSYYVDGFRWSADENVDVDDGDGESSQNSTLVAASTRLSDFESMYPMIMVKRIDFLQPAQALSLGNGNSGGALVITTIDGSEAETWTRPDNLKVITPLGYQKPVEFYSPKYELTARNDGSDLRSTIYWNPCVNITDGKAQFDFFTSDNHNTTYTIRVEGLTDDGEIIQASSSIPVQ